MKIKNCVSLLLIIITPSCFAQGVLEHWKTNGAVMAITRQDDRVFVGGSFDQVSKPVLNSAIIDVESNLPDYGSAKVNGVVSDVVSDKQGGFFYFRPTQSRFYAGGWAATQQSRLHSTGRKCFRDLQSNSASRL